MMAFFRALKFAFQDMGRNISLSLMTVFILMLMLLSMNTLVALRVVTSEATTQIKDQIDVSIHFVPDATEEDITEVQAYIKAFPEVTSLQTYSRDEVLQNFQSQYSQNKDVLAALNELGDNPLGATIVVKTRQPGDYQNIIAALQVPEYEHMIETKTFEDTQLAISRIDTITTQVERFTIALSGFFAFIAFLIIFNTVRVAIYTQRIEISIKKLVGATNWFIRAPYIIEALIFSLVSVALSYGIVYSVVQIIDPYIAVIFDVPNMLTNYFTSNILLLLSTQFVVVLVLTVVTSLLAMRRHLRV